MALGMQIPVQQSLKPLKLFINGRWEDSTSDKSIPVTNPATGDSARLGLRWWQTDIGWYFIYALEAVGLANNVRRPRAR